MRAPRRRRPLRTWPAPARRGPAVRRSSSSAVAVWGLDFTDVPLWVWGTWDPDVYDCPHTRSISGPHAPGRNSDAGINNTSGTDSGSGAAQHRGRLPRCDRRTRGASLTHLHGTTPSAKKIPPFAIPSCFLRRASWPAATTRSPMTTPTAAGTGASDQPRSPWAGPRSPRPHPQNLKARYSTSQASEPPRPRIGGADPLGGDRPQLGPLVAPMGADPPAHHGAEGDRGERGEELVTSQQVHRNSVPGPSGLSSPASSCARAARRWRRGCRRPG